MGARIIEVVLAVFFMHSTMHACTGIKIVSTDGAVIYARTLEWREPISSHGIMVPQGTVYQGTSVGGTPGLKWEVNYGFVGIALFSYPYVLDGMNEKGLAAGIFSFKDDIAYHESMVYERSMHLAPWELITYLLSMCASIQDVIALLPSLRVVPVFLHELREVPPVHYIIHDSSGASCVIEHENHEFRVYQNPLGIFTNAPSFDNHIQYLTDAKENYSAYISDNAINDFSSKMRFARAHFYVSVAPASNTAYEALNAAFHILNQFDIPRGSYRGNLSEAYTYTHWTSAADLKHMRYYFKTYDNQSIRAIDYAVLKDRIQDVRWFLLDADSNNFCWIEL